MIDDALPKILCAEETGDAVSDLYGALRFAIDQAKTDGIDSPRDNRTCYDRASSRQRRRMTGNRSDVWEGRFGFAFGITLSKVIEEDDVIRGTRGPRGPGWGTGA